MAPAAAFVQYCATARMIDAIKVGDWLLHHRHITLAEVAELVRRDDWRPGAAQVRRVLPHLDAASRSLKESESRALVVFAGLPRPEVNVDLVVNDRWLGCVDLLFRVWLLVLEYEGRSTPRRRSSSARTSRGTPGSATRQWRTSRSPRTR